MKPRRTIAAALALILCLFSAVSAQETWCGKRYKTPEGKDPPPSDNPFGRKEAFASNALETQQNLVFFQSSDSSLELQSSCNLSDNCVAASSLETSTRPRKRRFNVQTRFLPYSWEQRGSVLVEIVSEKGTNEVKESELWFDAIREGDKAVVVKRTKVEVDKLEELQMDLDDVVERPSSAEDSRTGKLACRIFESKDSEHPIAKRTISVIRVRESQPRGSTIVKIDALHRASFVDKPGTHDLQGFLGFGGMTSGEWVLSNASASMRSFAARGLNMAHVVPGGALADVEAWRRLFDAAHENGLLVQYNLRHSYKNLTQLKFEIETFKDHPALHSWYTSDEPDGFDEDTKYTKESYELIKRLDPYHPVSLVLNCHDFRTDDFTPYTDILYSDPYPIGVDCRQTNATFGCCGCDSCEGMGDVKEVGKRTDQFLRKSRYKFQPVWIIVQAFGRELWWSRVPTRAEVRSMIYLALTHGATGISWWISPSELEDVLSQTGLELKTIADRRLSSLPNPMRSNDTANVHSSAWVHGDGAILVFVVNGRDSHLGVGLSGAWSDKSGRWTVVVGSPLPGGVQGSDPQVALEPFGVKVLLWHPL